MIQSIAANFAHCLLEASTLTFNQSFRRRSPTKLRTPNPSGLNLGTSSVIIHDKNFILYTNKAVANTITGKTNIDIAKTDDNSTINNELVKWKIYETTCINSSLEFWPYFHIKHKFNLLYYYILTQEDPYQLEHTWSSFVWFYPDG